MESLKLLIVEDDVCMQRAVEMVVASHFAEIQVIGKTDSVAGALEAIREYQPELLLMDIHLSDGTAFDILRQSQDCQHKVVFMSAYQEYALEALRFSAVEFVFKPFDINELIVAIDKAIEQIHDAFYPQRLTALFNNIDNPRKMPTVVLQGRDQIKVCNIKSIVWAKAIQGGANFYFEDGAYFFAEKPLRRYEGILNNYNFFRCHPHYLINLNHLKEVDPETRRLKLSNSDEVLFEERRYAPLMSALHALAAV